MQSSAPESAELWDEAEEHYTGSYDGAGEPHGRGTVHYSSGDVFQGHFYHGVKHGRGTFFFQDGSCLSGYYEDDSLEGPGVYTFPDGSWMEGTYMEGELNGAASEYDHQGVLTFRGQYTDNLRSGVCWIYNQDGGCVVGEVAEDGSMSGHDIAYIYPDGITALVGHFNDGVMVKAQEATVTSRNRHKPHFIKKKSGAFFKQDISTNDIISSDPMAPDAYEQRKVYVGQSSMPGAGEGLFSKVDEAPGVVMSFYNGVRLTHPEVDSRPWDDNSNTISLDDDTVIDVPPHWATTHNYCASLGHKANHAFTHNCIYDVYDHPRFGSIKCIRTIKPVRRDEELTVFYGYEHRGEDTEAPQWYLDLKRSVENGNRKYKKKCVPY